MRQRDRRLPARNASTHACMAALPARTRMHGSCSRRAWDWTRCARTRIALQQPQCAAPRRGSIGRADGTRGNNCSRAIGLADRRPYRCFRRRAGRAISDRIGESGWRWCGQGAVGSAGGRCGAARCSVLGGSSGPGKARLAD